jgi:hypothetical protein
MERTFELEGRKYQLSKIDAMKQYHIVRKIGPLLADLVSSMKDVVALKADGLTESQKLEEIAKVASPIMNGLSKLSDADSEYVLFRLLAAVEVEQPQFRTWAKVAVENGIMMQDLELPTLLQLAGKSLAYNLSSFFRLLQRPA